MADAAPAYSGFTLKPIDRKLSKVLIAVASCAKDLNKNAACLETWAQQDHGVVGPDTLSDSAKCCAQVPTDEPGWQGKRPCDRPAVFCSNSGWRGPLCSDHQGIGRQVQFAYDIVMFDGKMLGVSDEYMELPAKIKAICEYMTEHEYDFMLKADSDTFLWIDRLLRSGFEAYDYSGWTGGIVEPQNEYASGGAGYFLSRKAAQIVADAALTDDTCEDRWVGRILYDAGIIVHRDARHAHGDHRLPFEDKTLVTFHPASPKRMRELFEMAKGASA